MVGFRFQMFKLVLAVCIAAVTWAAGVATGHAADLRISFDELLKLTQPLTKSAKIRLHNVPPNGPFGGLFDTQGGSYIKLGETTQELPLTAYTFAINKFGSARYAYYFNDINTSEITVTAERSALRISVRFEEDKPELVGGCYKGPCAVAGALPIIEWRKPGVDIDLTPIRFHDGVSFSVKQVRVRGRFVTICWSQSVLCPLGRAWAQRQINRSKSVEMPKAIKKALDNDANREKVAALFDTFLRVGTSGPLKIKGLDVEPRRLRVSFEF